MRIKDCKVGMRVRVISTDVLDAMYNVKKDMVGTIVELDTDGLLLVQFDNFDKGHDGYEDKYKGHKDMWYVFAEELEEVK